MEDHNLILGKIFFIGNDGSQNIFVNQAKSITIKQVNNNVSPWNIQF